MKHRTIHIAFLFSMLLIAGCKEHDPPLPKEANPAQNPGNVVHERGNNKNKFTGNVKINSRFKENAMVNPDIAYQYYIPAEDIGKLALISLHKFEQTRESREQAAALRKSYNSLEPDFFKSSVKSQEVFFTAVFDNDIFDYTDYYYTNGISLEFYHPAISSSPLTQLLPGLRNSVNYYGITLAQNMYTPRKLENPDVLVGDRPFAAYLTLGHKKISLSNDLHRRLETELTLGIIGPAALGSFAQDAIHSNEPVGWVNQVKNDLVANYSIRFDQGIYNGKNVELAVTAGGQAGTLNDNAMAGVYLQLGKMNSRYTSLFQTTDQEKHFSNRIRYYFSIDLKNKLIFYDATLQGGMLNHESVYKLDGDQVSRYVFTGTASVGIGLGRYSLEASQVYLTPEFDGGRHHFWFRIRNIFYLD